MSVNVRHIMLMTCLHHHGSIHVHTYVLVTLDPQKSRTIGFTIFELQAHCVQLHCSASKVGGEKSTVSPPFLVQKMVLKIFRTK